MHKSRYLIMAGVVILSGCMQGNLSPSLSSTETSSPTSTLSPTETPTPTVTNTLTPTETNTATPIAERDMKPHTVHEFNAQCRGVAIHGQIITDDSLTRKNPPIKEVSMPDNTACEVIARSIFAGWWKNGIVAHEERPQEADFQEFMRLWSQAQQSGLREDWEKVQFTIVGNDLNDGVAYKGGQNQFVVWPYYEGEYPEEIIGDEINLVFVAGSRVKNLTITYDWFEEGFGTNVDGKTINFYIAPPYGSVFSPGNLASLAARVSILPWWVANNHGGSLSYSTPPTNDYLYGLLRYSLQLKR